MSLIPSVGCNSAGGHEHPGCNRENEHDNLKLSLTPRSVLALAPAGGREGSGNKARAPAPPQRSPSTSVLRPGGVRLGTHHTPLPLPLHTPAHTHTLSQRTTLEPPGVPAIINDHVDHAGVPNPLGHEQDEVAPLPPPSIRHPQSLQSIQAGASLSTLVSGLQLLSCSDW